MKLERNPYWDELLGKDWKPPPMVRKRVKSIGLVEHVRQYATSVAEIYLWCRLLNLDQETFEAAKQVQMDRLNKSLEKVLQHE